MYVDWNVYDDDYLINLNVYKGIFYEWEMEMKMCKGIILVGGFGICFYLVIMVVSK